MNNLISKNHKNDIQLTIAIPTFNRANYLNKTLECIVSQLSAFSNVELIVIDNASTDETYKVCEKYEELDNFSYYRLDQNLGMSASQYECLLKANGNYLLIFADDDYLESNGIQIILEAISKGYDLYAFNYKSAKFKQSALPIGPINSSKFEYGFQLMNHPSVGHMSGLVYRKNLIFREAQKLLEIFPLKYFNSTRGIYGPAFTSLANNSSESFYEGKVIFSAEEQDALDYNGLSTLCLLIFSHFRLMLKLNIVGDEIFDYQMKLVSARIRRSYIRWYPTLNEKESIFIDYLLTPSFNKSFINKLIFRFLKFRAVKKLLLSFFDLLK